LILIDTALITRLSALATGAKDLWRHVHLDIRADAVSQRPGG